MQRIDIMEMGIAQLLAELDAKRLTSVDLTCAYLNRIAYYDRSGPCLRAVPVLNPDCLVDAAASDRRRSEGRARPLEGIPFTVKDSYKAKGLTVASGSPALAELVATDDAVSVAILRAAGAVLIGKTNMPPMAAGGMQPGVYGYARSPYNPDYLTAAWGSGSSNGSATATASSMCPFGMAEETVSSGRSPLLTTHSSLTPPRAACSRCEATGRYARAATLWCLTPAQSKTYCSCSTCSPQENPNAMANSGCSSVSSSFPPPTTCSTDPSPVPAPSGLTVCASACQKCISAKTTRRQIPR